LKIEDRRSKIEDAAKYAAKPKVLLRKCCQAEGPVKEMPPSMPDRARNDYWKNQFVKISFKLLISYKKC